MTYEKPLIRPMVATDSPACTTSENIEKTEIYNSCSCLCLCPCECKCLCPNQYQYVNGEPHTVLDEQLDDEIVFKQLAKINEDYILRKEKIGALLFNTKEWDIQILNETGSAIIEELAANNSFNEIAVNLLSVYKANKEDILFDLKGFIRILKNKGIISFIYN